MRFTARQATPPLPPPTSGTAFAASLPPLSRAQRREQQRRCSKLAVFHAARARGLNRTQAAQEAQINGVTCWRWLRAQERDGEQGLVPNYRATGRKSTADRLGITPQIREAVQRLWLAVQNSYRAWRLFAETPECPATVAAFIRAHEQLPPSLLNLARPERATATVYRCAGGAVVLLRQEP